MTEPVTTIAAGAILKLAFDEFIKSGAGETAKKLTGEALMKANSLRKLIWNYFSNKKNKKATESIAIVEETGSESALGKLEVYLEAALEDDVLFADQLRILVQEIKSLSNVKQVMVDGLKTEENLEAEGFIQETSSKIADLTMLKDIEAKGSIKLKNFEQKS